jgi:hypothetical protein
MDQGQDSTMSETDREKNVIESVSALSNVYLRLSQWDMFAAAHNCDFLLDHSSTIQSADNKMTMKVKFGRMGIDLKWMVVFPNVDDCNGRHPGHNCFWSSVSDSTGNNHMGHSFTKEISHFAATDNFMLPA